MKQVKYTYTCFCLLTLGLFVGTCFVVLSPQQIDRSERHGYYFAHFTRELYCSLNIKALSSEGEYWFSCPSTLKDYFDRRNKKNKITNEIFCSFKFWLLSCLCADGPVLMLLRAAPVQHCWRMLLPCTFCLNVCTCFTAVGSTAVFPWVRRLMFLEPC